MGRPTQRTVSASDQGKARAAEIQAHLEDLLRQRLGETDALHQRLREALEALPGRIGAAKAKLEGRRDRIKRLEALVLSKAVALGELDQGERREAAQAQQDKRLARLNRLQALAMRSTDRLAELEAERARLLIEVARLDKDAASYRAALEDGAVIIQRAEAAGARRASEVRRDQKDAGVRAGIATAEATKFDRDGPTPEQIFQRGLEREPGSVRAGELGADVPDAVRRLHRARKLTDGEVRAAVMYYQDYRFGTDRAKMVSTYEPGVSGGKGAGETAESKLQAFERWRAAHEALPAEFRAVVDAVVLNGVTLTDAPGEGSDYAQGETNRRAANGTLLVCGLKRLRHWYRC